MPVTLGDDTGLARHVVVTRLSHAALGEATARGVSEGVLAHDAHNSYHYADAGRLYELEMLLNAFAIASRLQEGPPRGKKSRKKTRERQYR